MKNSRTILKNVLGLESDTAPTQIQEMDVPDNAIDANEFSTAPVPSEAAEAKIADATVPEAEIPKSDEPVPGDLSTAPIVDESKIEIEGTTGEIENTPIAAPVADPTELTTPDEPATKEIGEGVVDLIVEKTEAAIVVALENDTSCTEAVLVVLDSEEVKDAIADLPDEAQVVAVELPEEVAEQVEEVTEDVTPEEVIVEMAEENEALIQATVVDAEQADELMEAAASLEAFVGKDLSEHDLNMFKIGLESLALRCGIEATDMVPSVESMVADKPETIQVGLEEIGKLTASIEAGIFDGVRKVVSSIGNFFAFIFKSYDSILKKIKTLRGEIKAAGKLEVRDITVSNLHRLAVGGKVDPASIIKGLDNTAKVSDTIYTKYTKQVIDLYKEIGAAIVDTSKVFGKSRQDVDRRVTGNAPKDVNDDEVSAVANHGNKILSEFGYLGKIAASNPEFSGGYVFANINGSNTELPDVYQKGESVTSKQTIKSLTSEQATKVLDSAEDIIKVIRDRAYVQIRLQNTSVDAVIGAWKKDAEKNPGLIRFVSRVFKSWAALQVFQHVYDGRLLRPSNRMAVVGFGAVNAAVAYVAKSVK